MSLQAAEKKKVVFLVGDDLNHASGTHEFYAGALLLKESLANSQVKDQIESIVVNNWPEDISIFNDADVIVHYYKGNKTHFMNSNHSFIGKLADKGVSQMLIHYGCDPEKEAESSLKKWTGGVYKTGYSSNPHWFLKAKLETHPINSGVKAIELQDEWYMKMDFEHDCALDHGGQFKKGQVHAIMSGSPDAAKGNSKLTKALAKNAKASALTVFWAKERVDGGRGTAVTGAHFHKNWANDGFRKQVLNAIAWCAKVPIPTEGVTSPRITEDMINQNLDKRKPKFARISLAKASTKIAPEVKSEVKKKKRKPKKKKNKEAAKAGARPGNGKQVEGIHPFFDIKDIHPENGVELKISAMCFSGDDLYVTCMNPNRTNKMPDRNGKLYKISGATTAQSGKDLKITLLADGLYEPGAVGVFKGKVYIGEKTEISRFDDLNNDGLFSENEKVVLVDGLSAENFHTWTFGFEKYTKNGELYLCGNFSTHIMLGGKRLPNTQVNKDVKRGSTFIIGPISGSETKDSVKIDYIAGGYRTPNGIAVDDDNAVYVTDNQGIFNPANKLIRLEQDGFYGHFQLSEGKKAAFQPKDVEPNAGASGNRSPVTLYLPQSYFIARSPGQPVPIKNQKGEAAAYNGQLFVPDFTSGSIHRASLEKVNGVWQGALFRFSAGASKKDGTGGLTGGPNRMVMGSDNNFYIGQIGAGNLWTFNKDFGLQRLSLKEHLSKNINEMLKVKVIPGGIEIEFLRPLPAKVLTKDIFKCSQWTYIPTNGYGGPKYALESVKVESLKVLEGGKKVHLQMPGLKDSDSRPLLQKGLYSNENVGWVLHVEFDPKVNGKPLLWAGEFWYTMQKNMNKKSTAEKTAEPIQVSTELNPKKIYAAMCASCHSTNGTKLAGPSFKGLMGKTQTVIRAGKEVEVKVTRDYLHNAIKNPLSEFPKGSIPAMPPLGLKKEQIEAMVDFIQRVDGE